MYNKKGVLINTPFISEAGEPLLHLDLTDVGIRSDEIVLTESFYADSRRDLTALPGVKSDRVFGGRL